MVLSEYFDKYKECTKIVVLLLNEEYTFRLLTKENKEILYELYNLGYPNISNIDYINIINDIEKKANLISIENNILKYKNGNFNYIIIAI